MENYSIPSVANNHRTSFKSALAQSRAYLDKLDKEYDSEYELLTKLNNEKSKSFNSLEELFKKYNFEHQVPLVKCNAQEIEKYSEDLRTQLAVAFVSVDSARQVQMSEDSVEISAITARVKQLMKNVEIISTLLDKNEKDLSTIRIPEADSTQEFTINMKDKLKAKREAKKAQKAEIKEQTLSTLVEEPIIEVLDPKVKEPEDAPVKKEDVFNISNHPGVAVLNIGDVTTPAVEEDEEDIFKTISLSLDEIDEANRAFNGSGPQIPKDIFSREEELIDELNEDKVVTWSLTPGLSLIDYVEGVYQDTDYWRSIYLYGNNKVIIDEVAANLGMSLDELVHDKNALSNVVLEFPLSLYASSDDKVEKTR